MIVMAAVVLVVMTGMTAAPPVWASGISPMGFLLVVLAFSLYAPEAMPAWLIALVSLLQDAAVGVPFGFSGMVALVAVAMLDKRARSYQRQAPYFVWAALAAFLAAGQLLTCFGAGLFGLKISWRSAGLSWMVTLPFIPVMQWLAARLVKQAGSM